MNVILTDADLIELTRKTRVSAQARELDALGIPYRRRRDRSIVVMRDDLPIRHETTQTPPRTPRLRLPASR